MDQALAAALTERLRAESSVVAAWVFGSVARGEETSESDVDVAVFLDRRARPTSLDDLPLGLEADLAQIAGREVQVVVVDWAPYDLVHRVLRDGVLLLDRDRVKRIRFEIDARNRYFDMQPIWRRYRRTGA